MKNNRIIDIITREINSAENDDVLLTDKGTFNQYKTCKKILNHQNNFFENPSDKVRFFFNIGNSRRDTGVKKLDFDTKDVDVLVEDNPDAISEEFLARAELKHFLFKNKQGAKFNDIVEKFVDWGNVVLKEDDAEGYKIVNLLNLYVINQTAETLEETTTIEKHKMTAKEVLENKVWDNTKETVQMFQQDSQDNAQVDCYIYERRGELTLKDYKEAKGKKANDGDEDKYVQTLVIAAIKTGQNNSITQQFLQNTIGGSGVLLFCEEVKGKKNQDGREYYKPYKEAHFGAYEGRWFRRGYREALFDYQDRANILGNQIYEAMKWSSLHIFWSADDNIAGKNLFESIRNGQIIKASQLNVLPVEERNLSAQINEWNRLMDLADKETQSFEVATGEQMPSGTTLGQVQIQTAVVGQYFDYKREKLALMMEDVFNEWIMPSLMHKMNAEHILEITGDSTFIDTFLNAAAISQYIKLLPTLPPHGNDFKEALINDIKTAISKQEKYMVKMAKDVFKGITLRARVVISGESINKQLKVNNGLQLIGYITNPMIMQNQDARNIINQIAASLGYKLSNIPPEMPEAQPQGQPGQPAQPKGEIKTEEMAV
jgi:hypothetical protein